MLGFHVEKKADMTVSCLEVPVEEAAGAFGVIAVDETGQVIGFEEKPAKPAEIPGKPGMCLASMGNYVFSTEFLFQELINDADHVDTDHDFGKDIIPEIIGDHKVYAFPFLDTGVGEDVYWRDVGTLDAFWEANIELIGVSPDLNLYNENWPILTYQAQLPPAKFVFDEVGRRGAAIDSMVSGGCVISGAMVKRSLLFSNVKVHSYAEVRDSVILPNVDIGEKARITKAIIDRGCEIEAGDVIGEDHDEDRRRGFRVTEKGVVLVTPDMLKQSTHAFR